MMIAQYFVEFIFYSFLGWVWESIYCTINKKQWQDRGFLFGPICPIYGSCVVAAEIVFRHIPHVSNPDFPVWGIFLICMVGSAIAEFSTSWVMEKRFHAVWWDYSNLPFNLQGRICLPVSAGFGLAGVVVVKYLIPLVSNFHTGVHPLVYEGISIVWAMIFGADFALTEASLSTLLKTVENYRQEFNKYAEMTYNTISETPKKIEEGILQTKESVTDTMTGVKNRMMEMSDRYIGSMSGNQRRILDNIQSFRTKDDEKRILGKNFTEHLKTRLRPEKKEEA